MATSSNKKTMPTSPSSVGRPPSSAVKFARRTSSGRVMSLSRDDDLDMSGEMSGENDYINYTVMMPPTPDNQPGDDSKAESTPGTYGASRFGTESRRRNDGGGDSEAAKMDRRMSVMNSSNNKSILLRSQTGDFDHNRWLFETKGTYGIGNAYWSQKEEDAYNGPARDMNLQDFIDEKPWKPLTRKVSIPPAILSPYRYIWHPKNNTNN